MSLYQENRGKFYDGWESLGTSERQVEQKKSLEALIEFARRFPFYQSRLEKVDVNAPHPLAEVPVLKPEEFRKALPPFGTDLVNEGESDFTVFQSGGTTGIPKTTLFSHQELEGLNLPNARGFYAVGLTPEDRVANLWAVGSLYMTFVHINRMLQQYGCQNFPFSNHTDLDFIHGVVKNFGINCLTGIASSTLNAVRAMDRLGLDGVKIKKIYYGGEHFYEADKEEIRRKVGAEIIAAPGYGTVDTWYLGYQCLHCDTGVFHAHDDQVLLEIVNEDKGNHCEANQVGMLYATPYLRRVSPIVRYRVGDRAKWLGEACPCGRTTPTFKLLGRGDDVLRVGYDSVDYAAIQAVVSKVAGLSGSLQMEKQRREGRDALILRIETDLPPSAYGETTDQLISQIMSNRPSLREFIEKGTVLPLEVSLQEMGTLTRNPKTGKLIRVIDSIKDHD